MNTDGHRFLVQAVKAAAGDGGSGAWRCGSGTVGAASAAMLQPAGHAGGA